MAESTVCFQESRTALFSTANLQPRQRVCSAHDAEVRNDNLIPEQPHYPRRRLTLFTLDHSVIGWTAGVKDKGTVMVTFHAFFMAKLRAIQGYLRTDRVNVTKHGLISIFV